MLPLNSVYSCIQWNPNEFQSIQRSFREERRRIRDEEGDLNGRVWASCWCASCAFRTVCPFNGCKFLQWATSFFFFLTLWYNKISTNNRGNMLSTRSKSLRGNYRSTKYYHSMWRRSQLPPPCAPATRLFLHHSPRLARKVRQLPVVCTDCIFKKDDRDRLGCVYKCKWKELKTETWEGMLWTKKAKVRLLFFRGLVGQGCPNKDSQN